MEKELQQLGLSDKETKTYLVSLELGPAAVQIIAKKAGLKRPTVYFAIEQLIKKGLMSSFEKGKKRFFTAESPERLVSLIAAQRKKAQILEEGLQSILPGLNSIFDLTGEKPKVKFFEGREGLRAIQDDILRSEFKSLEEFVPLDEAYKVFPPSAKDHRKRLVKKFKNISWREIYTSEKGAAHLKREGKIERRFVPLRKFPLSAEVVIYGKKIAIVTYRGKLMGVVIESQEIADSFRTIFNLAWEGADKYKQ